MRRRLKDGEHELPVICPHCGRKNDLASPGPVNHERKPEPGDALICWQCGGVNTIDDNGNAIKFPEDELAKLERDDPQFAVMREMTLRKDELETPVTSYEYDKGVLCTRCGSRSRDLLCLEDPELDDDGPNAGDATVCSECGTFFRFLSKTELREMGPAEERWVTMHQGPAFLHVITELKERHNGKKN